MSENSTQTAAKTTDTAATPASVSESVSGPASASASSPSFDFISPSSPAVLTLPSFPCYFRRLFFHSFTPSPATVHLLHSAAYAFFHQEKSALLHLLSLIYHKQSYTFHHHQMELFHDNNNHNTEYEFILFYHDLLELFQFSCSDYCGIAITRMDLYMMANKIPDLKLEQHLNQQQQQLQLQLQQQQLAQSNPSVSVAGNSSSFDASSHSSSSSNSSNSLILPPHLSHPRLAPALSFIDDSESESGLMTPKIIQQLINKLNNRTNLSGGENDSVYPLEINAFNWKRVWHKKFLPFFRKYSLIMCPFATNNDAGISMNRLRAKIRWQTVRMKLKELYQQRLERQLKTQREFIMLIEKHKLLKSRAKAKSKGTGNGNESASARSSISEAASQQDYSDQEQTDDEASSPENSDFLSESPPGRRSIPGSASASASGSLSQPAGSHSPSLVASTLPAAFNLSGSESNRNSPIQSPRRPSNSSILQPLNLTQYRPVPSSSSSGSLLDKSLSRRRRRPIVIFIGGGLSAGKSSVLNYLKENRNELFGIAQDAVYIESDAFKLKDPVFQALPSTDPNRAVFVHSNSLKVAEETLITAVRARRDIVIDGSMMWRSYVEQTIHMIRHSHLHTFTRGRGFKLHPDGTTTEEYFIEDKSSSVSSLVNASLGLGENQHNIDGDRKLEAATRIMTEYSDIPEKLKQTGMFPCSPGDSNLICNANSSPAPYSPTSHLGTPVVLSPFPSGSPTMLPPSGSPTKNLALEVLPYRIAMLAVTVPIEIAISRSVRRAVNTGRAVPMSQLINSYRLFAAAFPHYAKLVDAYALYCNVQDDLAFLPSNLQHSNSSANLQQFNQHTKPPTANRPSIPPATVPHQPTAALNLPPPSQLAFSVSTPATGVGSASAPVSHDPAQPALSSSASINEIGKFTQSLSRPKPHPLVTSQRNSSSNSHAPPAIPHMGPLPILPRPILVLFKSFESDEEELFDPALYDQFKDQAKLDILSPSLNNSTRSHGKSPIVMKERLRNFLNAIHGELDDEVSEPETETNQHQHHSEENSKDSNGIHIINGTTKLSSSQPNGLINSSLHVLPIVDSGSHPLLN